MALAAVEYGSSVTYQNDMYNPAGIQYQVWKEDASGTAYTVQSASGGTVSKKLVKAKDVNGDNAILTIQVSGGSAKSGVVELAPGEYWVREVASTVTSASGSGRNTGYTADPTFHYAKVDSSHTEENPLIVNSTENFTHELKGTITKTDADFGTTASGDASLANGIYRLRYWDATSASGNPDKTWFFKSDATGKINIMSANKVNIAKADTVLNVDKSSDNFWQKSDGSRIWLAGTYIMDEVCAPVGYKLDTTPVTVKIEHDNDATTSTDNNHDLEFAVSNHPDETPLAIQKVDSEVAADVSATNQPAGAAAVALVDGVTATTTQGDTDHMSTYRVFNVSDHPIKYDGKTIANVPADVARTSTEGVVGEITCVKPQDWETSASGKWVTERMSLPYGTYKVVEIAAGEGMRLDAAWSQTITLHANAARTKAAGTNANQEITQANDPLRGGMVMAKVDSDGDLSDGSTVINGGFDLDVVLADIATGQGDAKLDGAEFIIINRSRGPVKVDGAWYKTDAKVATVTTAVDDDGRVYAHTSTSKSLPYGTYEVRETVAPEGYKLTDVVDDSFGGQRVATRFLLHPSEDEHGYWFYVGSIG